MKIKILLAPALIVIIITMIIWLVYPAYTNGVDGVSERYQKLKKQESFLAGFDKQYDRIGGLMADLNANAADNAVVFGYIPQDREEEKIIENLNSLAKDSTLSVLNISAVDVKTEITAKDEIVDPTPKFPNPALMNGNAPIVASELPVSPKAVAKKMNVSLSVAGDYGNIKNLLEKIQKLKRFNKVSALEIKAALKEDQTPSGALLANATLEFNYLKPQTVVAEGDINNAVFSAETFNRSVIEAIKNSRNINFNSVAPGQKGKSNPFLP